MKKFTAIAEIISQVKSDAIQVNSAAKIKQIPTREKFAYADVYTEYQEKEPEVIEVSPKYESPKQERKPEKVVEDKKVEEEQLLVEKVEDTKPKEELVEKTEEKSVPEPEVKKAAPPPPKVETIAETKAPQDNNNTAVFPNPATNIRVGLEGWGASGKASAGSSFAPWIINRIEAETDISITNELKYRPTLGVSFGKTGAGTYNGLNLDNFIFSPIFVKGAIPTLNYVDLGGAIDIDTMGVSKETFGGFDAISFGLLGKAKGIFRVDDLKRTFQYNIGLGLNFFGFGQMGVNGVKESLSGMREFKINGELISDLRLINLNLGSTLQYNLKTLKYDSGEVKVSMFTIALTGSMQF